MDLVRNLDTLGEEGEYFIPYDDYTYTFSKNKPPEEVDKDAAEKDGSASRTTAYRPSRRTQSLC